MQRSTIWRILLFSCLPILLLLCFPGRRRRDVLRQQLLGGVLLLLLFGNCSEIQLQVHKRQHVISPEPSCQFRKLAPSRKPPPTDIHMEKELLASLDTTPRFQRPEKHSANPVQSKPCGRRSADDDDDDEDVALKFAVLADPQLGFLTSNGDRTEEVRRLRLGLSTAVTADCPSFVIIVGDLCNKFPDEQEQHIRQQQLKDFIQALDGVAETTDIPIFTTCGNHDVGNRPTESTVARHEAIFGSSYYSFWCGDEVFCIILNSGLLYAPRGAPVLHARQLDWLEKSLEQNKDARHIFLFSHHPFFVESIDEDANLGKELLPFVNKEVNRNYFQIPKEQRKLVLDLLHKYGVKYTFHGHTHYNKVTQSGPFVQVVTSAIGVQLGKDKPGYRMVKVLKDGRVEVEQYVTVLPDVEF